MNNDKYLLRYLPLFEQDLAAARDYIFYVVIGDVVEVRRFAYSRRNLTEIV